jgi:hypothetical protein
MKQKYQLRDDITYPEILFRDKRRNLHFIIADLTAEELNTLHSHILSTWKSILMSLHTTRDENQMMSLYEKLTSNAFQCTQQSSENSNSMFIQEKENK